MPFLSCLEISYTKHIKSNNYETSSHYLVLAGLGLVMWIKLTSTCLCALECWKQ